MDNLHKYAERAILKSKAEKTANAKWILQSGKKATQGGSKAKWPKPKWQSLKDMGPMSLLGVVAAGVIVSQFIKRLIDAGERLGIKMMEPAYYKKMLEANPKLLEEKEEKVARIWGSLYNTSPSLAKDPVAAGAFIRQNINAGYLDEFGGPPIDTYKTLADTEGKIQSNRDSGAADTSKSLISGLSLGLL